ncbi:MAG: HRDC domain-containing protein, partial [Defluviitaleaceae bacterium]|nr:HRDC domain-containing protein [Defluviitaleaceae bacterium]
AIGQGFLRKTTDQFMVAKITQKGADFLKQSYEVHMRVEEGWGAKTSPSATASTRFKKAKAPLPTYPINEELLEALKALRLDIAKQNAVPAFVVFNDATLIEMCQKMPRDGEELLDISGIGQMKATRYGKEFLEVIAQFEGEKGEAITTSAHTQYNHENINPSPNPISVNFVADMVNVALMKAGREKISGQMINNWLIKQGLVEIIEIDDKNTKMPTPQGVGIGIKNEKRTIRGEELNINLFEEAAQKFIAENALDILKLRR